MTYATTCGPNLVIGRLSQLGLTRALSFPLELNVSRQRRMLTIICRSERSSYRDSEKTQTYEIVRIRRSWARVIVRQSFRYSATAGRTKLFTRNQRWRVGQNHWQLSGPIVDGSGIPAAEAKELCTGDRKRSLDQPNWLTLVGRKIVTPIINL